MKNVRAKADYVVYRLQCAAEDLADAKFLVADQRLRAALNRAYYSMLHAVSALAAEKDFNGKTHKGLIRWFHQHFVITGTFDRATGEDLSNAFLSRTESDYGDFVEIEAEAVAATVDRAENFLGAVENLIKTQQ